MILKFSTVFKESNSLNNKLTRVKIISAPLSDRFGLFPGREVSFCPVPLLVQTLQRGLTQEPTEESPTKVGSV